MIPQWSHNGPEMVPRPPPHPWLGETKLPRGKQKRPKNIHNENINNFVKMIPKWSQNVPKIVPLPPPHPRLG